MIRRRSPVDRVRNAARLLVPLLTAACQRGSPTVRVAPEPALGAVLAPVGPGPAATTEPPTKPPASCSELRTTAIAGTEDYGALQNVRVAASTRGALITWERNNRPRLGDTSQVGFATFLDRGPGADVLTTVTLPARAYASSVYTSVAPTCVGSALDLFTFGVAGAPTFATYSSGARPWHGIEVFQAAGPAPFRTSVLPFSLAESLAVAATAPVAIVAGAEAPCGSYYACPEFAAALAVGLPSSVRTLSMSALPHSDVLYRGTTKGPSKTFAPAVAASPGRVFAMFRVDRQLEGAWVSLDGRSEHAFAVGAEGDVGAPAVTFDRNDAYAVWAVRAAAEPYRLFLARIGPSGVGAGGLLDTGPGSAFAPAIASLDGKLVIAWMEGNDATRGRIRMGVVPVSRLEGPAPIHFIEMTDITDPTATDANRRDPELARSGDRLYVVWSDFTAAGPGLPMLRTLSCR